MPAEGMARQGAGGEAGVGLAQRHAVPARETAQDLDAAVVALAVGRMRHGLGLDGGVGGHALEALRLGGPGTLEGSFPAATPAPDPVFHPVVKGETPSKIAQRHLGNANKYPAIFEANKPMQTNPDQNLSRPEGAGSAAGMGHG